MARRPAKARRCADDDLCPQCRSAFAVAGEVRKEAYAVARPQCASNLIGVSRLAFPEQLIEIVFKAVLPPA